MPDPTSYTPGFDFTASDKGSELNVELADISVVTAELAAAVRDVRRSDGKLQNGSVTVEALAPGALGALGPNGDVVTAAVDAAEAAADAATAQVALATAQVGLATTQAGNAAASAAAAAASALDAAAAAAGSPIGFAAHRNSVDQTGIVSATPTKLTLGTEVFDQGPAYDAPNGRWTPPAGRYRMTATALFSAAVVDQQQYRAMIYKNGALRRQNVVGASGTVAQSVSVTTVDVASGSDFYEFFVQGDGAGSKTVSGAPANTWFEGSAL